MFSARVSVPRNLKKVATKIFDLADFKVGDTVFHRSWSLPNHNGDTQYPVVDRRPRTVTDIREGRPGVMYVYTGNSGFTPSELIKEQ